MIPSRTLRANTDDQQQQQQQQEHSSEKDSLLGRGERGSREGISATTGASSKRKQQRPIRQSDGVFTAGGSYYAAPAIMTAAAEQEALLMGRGGSDYYFNDENDRTRRASHHERTDTELTWGSNVSTESVARRVMGYLGRGGSSFSGSKQQRHHRHCRINGLSLVLLLLVVCYTIVVFFVPLALHLRHDRSTWCPYADEHDERPFFVPDDEDSPYENPDYILDKCRYHRMLCLLGLTLEDCDISRRMVVSVLLGGVIGYERRSADRPAGVRTMGLVSLGSCFFTICSIMAFKSSTMGWDASRVTAALPSGVGFLGGALIWKGSVFVEELGQEKHQVHGLTTAASLWLSAAIGVGAGGALYAVTIYALALVLFMLRYGPKLYEEDVEEEEEEEEEADLLESKEAGELLFKDPSVEQPRVSVAASSSRNSDSLGRVPEDTSHLVADPSVAEEEEELMPHEEMIRRLSEEPQNAPRLGSVTVVQKFNPERGIPHRRLSKPRKRCQRVPTFGS